MTEPGTGDATIAKNYRGSFTEGRFSMEGGKDELFFTGVNGHPEKFGVEKVRDFFIAARENPVDGLTAEELLMIAILRKSKGDDGQYKDLAEKINAYLESNTTMRAKIDEKMDKPEVISALDKIESKAGFNQ